MREILFAPSGILVDHRDRNGCNNQKNNLRFCTKSQNAANSRIQANTYSKYKGVHQHIDKRMWVATIEFQKHRKYLGWFDSEEKAALQYFGEFARLNIIQRKRV